ncbi:hypothetical protein PILCRDRAFT_303805 [Piloderma croceum F 1598]|uniref:Uncharacterized protein n=1 Tax=Piloderma croceum (strain F 1598) TaxID=765440 RepID=A0A0C3FSM0_PILCF|nr:hypothetical protein PILCRDRAFT_303805 [Piloderma croceum F 1598]
MKAKKKKRNAAAERNGSPLKVKKSTSKASGAPESSLEAAFSNVRNFGPIKSSFKTTKPSARRNQKKLDVDNFIEEESSDGNESYVGSDHTSDIPATCVPLTQAQAKVAAAAKNFPPEASSSRSRKREASGGLSLKPPAKRAKRQIVTSETCSEKSEERELPVLSLKSPARRSKRPTVYSDTSFEPSEAELSMHHKTPTKRAKRPIIISEASSQEPGMNTSARPMRRVAANMKAKSKANFSVAV